MTERIRGVTHLGENRWRVRVQWKDPQTGKVSDRSKVLENATLQMALDKREQLLREVQSGEIESVETLRAFAKSWLRGIWPNLCPSTRVRYVNALDKHIMPAFGDQPIDGITKVLIERWRDKLRATHAAGCYAP